MSKRNVFLFIPNIIGYLRIILLGLSCYYIIDQHRLGMALYIISNSLDAIDGLAARLFHQTSILGTMLDMLTDRMSTMCLLITLSHIYVEYFRIIMLLLVIDITSHWLHFFAAKLQGKESHKSTSNENSSTFMRLYYSNKLILTSVCAMEQLFYGSILMAYFERDTQYQSYLVFIALISAPGLIFKNWINLLQIYNSSKIIASIDEMSHIS